MIRVVYTYTLRLLFVPDGPAAPGIEGALASAARDEAAVPATELLLAEAGNVLLRKARRGELAEAEADAMRAAMLTLPIRFNAHGPLIQAALALAGIHRLSVYDALYLVLALRHGARLLTRDELLAGVAGRLVAG